MIEKKSISIEKNKVQSISLDFKSLRQHAITLIQQLSGNTWTDYNLHDPGVTILEMLCVAITDLAYRTDFSIQDLLADKNGDIQPIENSFISKGDILTTNPVTISDFRKAIQDEIKDVYNIWLEPVLSAHSSDSVKGLYRVYVQMTKEAAAKLNDKKETNNEEEIKEGIKDQVRRSFVSKRNLCEDWERDIIILEPIEIAINADMRVSEKAIPEEILAAIYSELENYINPPTRYYSEDELLAAGFKIEDIYAGPLLKKGFIPDNKMSLRREIIDIDDLVRRIMKIEGVVNVKDITMKIGNFNTGSKPYKLNKLNFPFLTINMTNPSIRIFKGKNEVSIDINTFNDRFIRIREISKRDFLSSFHKPVQDQYLKGVHKDIEHYYSIQNHFPLIYGIGEEGLAPEESNARKAQAKQLKAYLMLFEQLLANYLSQLANGKNLFSTDLTDKNALTYYGQPLYGIPGVKDLLKAFTEITKKDENAEWERFKNNRDNNYLKSMEKALETDDTYRKRKNRIFDHLLARFNIQLETYPVILFNSLYEDPTIDRRVSAVLEWEANIITDLVELSHDRLKSLDYLNESITTQKLTGFQKKLTKLLYIHNERMRPLSWVFDLRKESNGGTKKIHSLVWHNKHKKSSKTEGDNNENNPAGSFDFGEQTTDIFKYGIDINNYEIVHDAGKKADYQIRYKSPQEREGVIISEMHADELSATISIKELISYLKQISIESEGFHIVEHILLRPPLRSPSFGFGFYENKKTLLFQHNEWTNFETRENRISEILEVTTNIRDIPAFLHDKIHFSEGDNKMEGILANLQLKKEQNTRFFPRFELWVKLANNNVLKEDYFNFRMSVVLPAWPARFQDDNFRAFTEDLFRINAPAHLRIDFFWLNIFDMKKFEKLYFEWLNSLKNRENGVGNSELSEKLITFLKGDDYHVTSF